jgi:glutamine amidotransferase
MAPEDPAAIVATCTYGTEFPAIVVRENIIGVQFHPEKSQRAGVTLLQEFLNL